MSEVTITSLERTQHDGGLRFQHAGRRAQWLATFLIGSGYASALRLEVVHAILEWLPAAASGERYELLELFANRALLNEAIFMSELMSELARVITEIDAQWIWPHRDAMVDVSNKRGNGSQPFVSARFGLEAYASEAEIQQVLTALDEPEQLDFRAHHCDPGHTVGARAATSRESRRMQRRASCCHRVARTPGSSE